MNLRQKNKKLKRELEIYKHNFKVSPVPVLKIDESHHQILPCKAEKRVSMDDILRFRNADDQEGYVDLLRKDALFELYKFVKEFAVIDSFEDYMSHSMVVTARLDIVVPERKEV